MLKRPLVPLTALLWGLQFAFLSPALALILVGVYGATPGEVGWVLAIYNASGFVFSLVLPGWADRRGQYLLGLMACALLTVALAIALAVATNLAVATVALVVLGGPAGVGGALLFAHLRHSGAPPGEIVNTRAVISFAWVAGPPVATALMGWFGDRASLVAIAVIGTGTVALTLVMLRRSRRPEPAAAPVHGGAANEQPEAARVPNGRVAVIVVAFVLAQATNAAAVSALTLYVSEYLGLPVFWAGIALGLAAALEIPALLALGRLSGTRSPLVLLLTGCAAGVVYYAGMAFATSVPVLLVLQVPNAWFFAAISGVGLTLFQDLIPRPGIATGLYTNTRRVGSIIAGPVIGIASTPWSYPGVFATCAAMTLAAALATALAGRAGRRRRADPRDDSQVAHKPVG
ncbi:MAG: MFS transporter [Propionicimonas sp.]|uniref:MFS transporter n=1 Tax=Propionicimonas sp. TaxID=1955623 RepID=UPI003D129416